MDAITLFVLGLSAWFAHKKTATPAPAETASTAGQDQQAGQIIADTPTAPVQQVIVGNTLDTSEPLDVPPGPVPTFTVGEPAPSVFDDLRVTNPPFLVPDDEPAGVFPLPRSIDDPIIVEPEIIEPVTAPVVLEPLPVPVVALGVTILDPLPSQNVSGLVKWAALVTGVGALAIKPEMDSVNLPPATIDGGGTISGSFDASLFALGHHMLYVRVTNAAGQTTRASVPFVIVAPPVVVVAPVVAPTVVPVPAGNLSVAFTSPKPFADLTGVVGFVLSITNASGAVTVAPTIDGQARPAASGMPPTVTVLIDTATVSNSGHLLAVTVTDSAGRKGSASINFFSVNAAITPVTVPPVVTTPTAPSTPSAPPPSVPGLPPEVPAWQQNMTVIGKQKGAQFVASAATGKPDLALAYDPARVFEQIGRYTSDPAWNLYADTANKMYRDGYVFANNGGVSGIYRFTRGMRMHHERTGDPKDLQAIQLVRDNGAYAGAATPLAWTADVGRQREVAYLINAHVDGQALGLPPQRARRQVLVDQAYGHLQQMRDPVNGWKNGGAQGDGGAQISPFMFALTADALIDDWEQTGDARLIPELTATADFIWDRGWRPAQQAMTYNINPKNTTGDMGDLAVGSPDLNLLISPVYEFIYQQTHDQLDRDRADALFLGGVDTGALTPYGYLKGAWITGGNPKQFLESYKTSFDQVASRWGV